MSRKHKIVQIKEHHGHGSPYIPWKDLNFQRQKENNQNVAKCLVCKNTLKNIGYKRLLSHRNICKGSQESKVSHGTSNNEPIVQESNQTDQMNSEFVTTDAPSALTLFHQQTSVELSELDEYLGFFFFGCGISFNVLESEHFANFVHKLNPKYKLPTRKTLSNTILDNVYSKILKKTATSEPEKSVILLDGWKNKSKNEKYVVGIIHNADGKRFFLNSWDFTETSETALNFKKVCEEAIHDAKEKFNAEIYSVVSDNVSSMTCMGKQIDQWHETCHSHSGNLLAKDLVDSTFNKKVVKILNEYKSSFLERQLIKLGGSRIVLPGETRWCSYRDSYRCLLKNLPFMKTIINNGDFNNLSGEVIGLVMDGNLEETTLKFTILFDGICELVNKCQQYNFSIADSSEEWLKLEFPICDENLESILESRLKKVIKPINLAANLLHPVYRGKRFAENDKYNEMALNFIKENLNEDGLRDFVKYKNKSEIFSVLDEKDVNSSQTYWTLAETYHPTLAELAIKLLRIPSSTASLERLFSQWTFIHNKLRNRLGTERSKKLIHVYYTLKVEDVDNFF